MWNSNVDCGFLPAFTDIVLTTHREGSYLSWKGRWARPFRQKLYKFLNRRFAKVTVHIYIHNLNG